VKLQPIPFTWSGDAMVPHPRFKLLCHRQFTVSNEYVLAIQEEISGPSRRHYFAALRNAWMNLRDEDSLRFPTEGHLRKWLLIKAGFAEERTIVCDTKRDALNLAKAARSLDGYAVIVVSEKVVKIFNALSQGKMSKQEFQASKNATLDLASEMIGTDVRELKRQGESA
jgi:hypothetical protein